MAERVTKTRRHQSTKPQLERQRRARINNSLEELKTLVFSALYQDADQCSQKMEKAEILEMAVSYVKMLRDRKISGHDWVNERASDALCKYRAGFNDCTGRVIQFLKNEKDSDLHLKENLLTHLASCCQFLQASSQPAPAYNKPSAQCNPVESSVDECYNINGIHYWPPTPPPSPAPSMSFGNTVAEARNRGMTGYDKHGFTFMESQVLRPVQYRHNAIWRPWLSQETAVFENILKKDN